MLSVNTDRLTSSCQLPFRTANGRLLFVMIAGIVDLKDAFNKVRVLEASSFTLRSGQARMRCDQAEYVPPLHLDSINRTTIVFPYLYPPLEIALRSLHVIQLHIPRHLAIIQPMLAHERLNESLLVLCLSSLVLCRW